MSTPLEEQVDRNPMAVATAIDAGWIFTDSFWWVRPMRADDPELTHRPSIGFTADGVAYIRDAKDAVAFDRGRYGRKIWSMEGSSPAAETAKCLRSCMRSSSRLSLPVC